MYKGNSRLILRKKGKRNSVKGDSSNSDNSNDSDRKLLDEYTPRTHSDNSLRHVILLLCKQQALKRD